MRTSRLLWKSSVRYLGRHPWLMALSILGVALGVAVVVAIDLANGSAQRAFELSAERVTGTATHQVVGAGDGLREDVYRQLRVDLGVRDAAPVVEGYVTARGRTWHVLGIDPLAEAPFRPYAGGPGSGLDLDAFLTRTGTALLATPTAEVLGKALGDTLRVAAGGHAHVLEVVGLMAPAAADDNDDGAGALQDLLVVDVATAQQLFDLQGRLSRVDLLVPDDAAGEALLARLREALPEGVDVVRAAARTSTLQQMTRAFELNLTALSLLALVVGMFLIYNTMTFSVVQRRGLLGRLRALGVTRREVFRLVLAEALLIGAVGTVLGLLLGVVLGRGLVQLVTQTINDLYYVVSVRELALSPWALAKGAALGIGATLVATLAPAREATSVAVSTVLRRSQTEHRAQHLAPRLAVAGGVAVGAAVVLLAVGDRSIVTGYLALLGVLTGAALLTPAAVVLLARGLRPVMGRVFGVLGKMAARGVVATLSRTAVAVAALMVALAATVGVGVMVESFRETVVVWLGYSLQADVYVQPPNLVVRRGDASLAPEVVQRLRTADGVASAYTIRHVTTGSDLGRIDLAAVETGEAGRGIFRFKEGDEAAVWQAFRQDEAAIVSEPFSYRYGTQVGDTLRLRTDDGLRAFPVRGIFYDYGSDLGVAMIARSTYTRYYDDDGYSGLALYLTPGADVDARLPALREAAGDDQELFLRSNRALREASLEVFDRTFTITTVLRLLAVLVAFVGVLSALLALQLERARELAILRAEGMTPAQVWRYVTLQTGVMGLIAGVLAVPLGLALAYVLIFVINKRSFGWTLQLELPPGVLLQAMGLALLAALLAGLYPAWKMSRANPADALRDE